ncbi:hypothetical protein KKA14_06425, partial [bacterium]|nr:hypothetical protein [bacterium]
RSMVRDQKKTGSFTKKALAGSKEWRNATKQISKLKKAVKNKEEKILEIEGEIGGIEEQLVNSKLYQPECREELDQILLLKKNLDAKLSNVIEEWEEAQTELDKVSSGISNESK